MAFWAVSFIKTVICICYDFSKKRHQPGVVAGGAANVLQSGYLCPPVAQLTGTNRPINLRNYDRKVDYANIGPYLPVV